MVQLYDHRGQPVRRSDLKKDQAAPSATGVRNYAMLAPSKPWTPYKLAKALQAAATGDLSEQAKLFDDMEEKDTHIFAEVSKRKRAVTGRPWEVLPADDGQAAVAQAAFVQGVLDALPVSDILFDMLDGVGKGFSALELSWDLSSGQAMVIGAEHKPQAWFRYHPDRPELRLQDGSRDGEALLPYKWIVHRHKAMSGSPYKGALFRILAWLYLFRNYSLTAWAQFVEAYGIPLRLGKYPPGTPETDKDKLLAAVSAIANEAAVIIPQGMEVDIIDQAQGRNYSNPHERLLSWSQQAISIAVTGSTLTSSTEGSGGHSLALGQVHNLVRQDILDSDMSQVEAAFNSHLLRPLVSLNYGPQKAWPYLQLVRPDTEDKQRTATIISTLVGMGFRQIPLWWLRDKFNLPEPAEGEATLADLLGSEKPAPALNRALLALNRQGGVLSPEQAALDAASAGAANAAADAAQAMAATVLEIVRGSSSFEEARGRLAAAVPELNSQDLDEALARAVFTAEAWGRINGDGS